MKKEFVVILIIGLFTLAYVLDAVVGPLKIKLVTPYHFFAPELLTQYVFTSTSIVIKGVAILLSALFLISLTGIKTLLKGAVLILVSAFMQLYAMQQVATNSQNLPLEWSLSFTLAGIILIIPALFYLILGFLKKLHALTLGDDESDFDEEKENDQGKTSAKSDKNDFWENKS